MLLPLFITHNVDSSTVDLEQSNAEYDITRVVDSSTVDLEQSNAEFDITDVVDSSTVELEQPYDEFHITHNVDSSTVELEQPYDQFDITHNAESFPVLQEQRYDTIKKLCLDFHSTVILCIVTHLFTRKTKENGNGFFFSWKYLIDFQPQQDRACTIPYNNVTITNILICNCYIVIFKLFLLTLFKIVM